MHVAGRHIFIREFIPGDSQAQKEHVLKVHEDWSDELEAVLEKFSQSSLQCIVREKDGTLIEAKSRSVRAVKEWFAGAREQYDPVKQAERLALEHARRPEQILVKLERTVDLMGTQNQKLVDDNAKLLERIQILEASGRPVAETEKPKPTAKKKVTKKIKGGSDA